MRVVVFSALLVSLVAPGCVLHAGPAAPDVHVYGPPVQVHGRVRHFHAHGCGHASRWHGGRWVYFVHGHWEYVDGDRLYVLRTLRSQPASATPARPVPERPGRGSGSVREYDPRDGARPRPELDRPGRRRPKPNRPGNGNGRDDARPTPSRPSPARPDPA